MRPWDYLKSHVARVTCSLLLLVAVAVLLPPLGVGRDGVLLVLIICAILEAIPFAWGWLRQHGFNEALSALAREEEDAVSLARDLPEPEYPEGDLAWQAIQNVVRAAQAESNEAQAGVEEYRRYVETWVHEVKTPLAACRLMLANAKSPDNAQLSRELGRIDSYVEQALYYARSTSVEKDYLIRAVPADRLVKDAVSSRARTLIEAHMGVDLSGLAQPDGTVPELYCDPKWMDFVLGQLIDNAIKYRAQPQADGRAPRLSFSTRVEDAGTARERAVLSVSDNGCGIAEADLPRVFDRGFTGQNGRSHQKSTGMGLYLVRTLCQKMGLAVGVRSRVGVGTTIEIAFPRERSRMLRDVTAGQDSSPANLTEV